MRNVKITVVTSDLQRAAVSNVCLFERRLHLSLIGNICELTARRRDELMTTEQLPTSQGDLL